MTPVVLGARAMAQPAYDEKDATLAARKVKMSKSRSDLESECYSIRQREDGFVEVRDFLTGRLLEITYDPTIFEFMREQAELQELENPGCTAGY